MSKHNIFEFKDRDTISDALTEMLRTGANQLIQQAVQIELEELLAVNTHRLTSEAVSANLVISHVCSCSYCHSPEMHDIPIRRCMGPG